MKKAVLLINLGTPDAPDIKSLRRYLKQFLSDPRVMDIPPLLRWMVLNFFILPKRPKIIQPKYQAIWTEHGSPLSHHSIQLVKKLNQQLGDQYSVHYAMRYGNPSIDKVLGELKKESLSQLLIIPMMPQFASATTGSILEGVMNCIKNWRHTPDLRFKNQFYDSAFFIDSIVQSARNKINKLRSSDHVLFSFHGLPERHLINTAREFEHKQCGQRECCTSLHSNNSFCYKAQCYRTAQSIANGLSIKSDQYTVAFQSRLGREKWMGPYTNEVVQKLGNSGTKHLYVFCPSFIADCLETLEEIEIGETENFISNGGQVLTLIPSLNSEDHWVDNLAGEIQRM